VTFAEGKTTATFVSPRQPDLGAPVTISAQGQTVQASATVQASSTGPQPMRAQPIIAQAVPVQASTTTVRAQGTTTAVVAAPADSSATLIGTSKRDGSIGAPQDLLIAVRNVTASQLSSVAESFGEILPAPCKDEGDGATVRCTVTPNKAGTLRVAITRAGSHIPGSPVTIEVAGGEKKEESQKSPREKKEKSSSHKSTSGTSSSSSKKEETKKKEEPAPVAAVAAAAAAPQPQVKSQVELTTVKRTITRVTVGKSFTIRLQVGGSGGAAAEAPVKQNGKAVGTAKAKAGSNDTYEISWVPPAAGQYTTVLVIGGVEVGGSEFEFEAFNVPVTCRPIANSENIGPGIPCTITFAIDNATPTVLAAVVKGSDGKLGTGISTRKRADGTWDVNFTPPDSPSFTVELKADSTPVENKLTIQLV